MVPASASILDTWKLDADVSSPKKWKVTRRKCRNQSLDRHSNEVTLKFVNILSRFILLRISCISLLRSRIREGFTITPVRSEASRLGR
jgi:hypothetical protein